MRDVQFEEVGMENFGPYIDPMVLTFPNDRLTLLTGPNGIGKTMSLDAIPFTLYGITSKKAKGDDVVNNTIGKNCKTWVKFKINDDQYKVTRYHKYTKIGNTVILTKNKVDIKKGHRETLPDIEKLLCSQKAFMNTLMFGQKVKDFFTDLVDSDKKEIFRKILALEQYLTYYKQANIKLKEFNVAIGELQQKLGINEGLLKDTIEQIKILSDAKSRFYEEKQNSIDMMNMSLEENERLLNTWNDTLSELKVDFSIEKTIQELTQVQNEISSLEKETNIKFHELQSKRERKRMELEAEANKSKSEIKDKSNDSLFKFQSIEAELKSELNDLISANQKERHDLELQVEKLESKNLSLSERINEINHNVLEKDFSTCPTCEQDVTEDALDKLIKKVENFESERENNNKFINMIQEKIKEIRISLTPMSDEFNNKISNIKLEMKAIILDQQKECNTVELRLQTALNKVDEAVIDMRNKITAEKIQNKQKLEEEEKTLVEKKLSQEKEIERVDEIKEYISSLSQKIESITAQIEYKENEEYDETQLNSYIKKERDFKISIKDDQEQLSILSRKIFIHEFWKTGYSSSGIPSMLIDDSIPFMNEKISYYLELLTNGRYIVSFDTLDETKAGDFRDKISVRVIDTHTKANSRVQLSGGQTRIIDIATILTLGDLQSNIQDVKFNILLFDEIFDALDYENANYVSKVLNKLKIGKSIYVISHQHQDQLEPDATLTMR